MRMIYKNLPCSIRQPRLQGIRCTTDITWITRFERSTKQILNCDLIAFGFMLTEQSQIFGRGIKNHCRIRRMIFADQCFSRMFVVLNVHGQFDLFYCLGSVKRIHPFNAFVRCGICRTLCQRHFLKSGYLFMIPKSKCDLSYPIIKLMLKVRMKSPKKKKCQYDRRSKHNRNTFDETHTSSSRKIKSATTEVDAP